MLLIEDCLSAISASDASNISRPAIKIKLELVAEQVFRAIESNQPLFLPKREN